MAWTQVSGKQTYYEDQALTDTVPSTDSAEGAPLQDADAFTVVIEAEATRTLSGAGSLVGYIYDESVAAWVQCPELTQTVTTSGVRRAAYNYTVAGAARGTRVQFATSSITVSAGTTVRVYIIVSAK